MGKEGREYQDCLDAIEQVDWIVWLVGKVEGLAAVEGLFRPILLGATAAPSCWGVDLRDPWDISCDLGRAAFSWLVDGDLRQGYAYQFHAFRQAFNAEMRLRPYDSGYDFERAIKKAQAAVNALVKSEAETENIGSPGAKEFSKDICRVIAAQRKLPAPLFGW